MKTIEQIKKEAQETIEKIKSSEKFNRRIQTLIDDINEAIEYYEPLCLKVGDNAHVEVFDTEVSGRVNEMILKAKRLGII